MSSTGNFLKYLKITFLFLIPLFIHEALDYFIADYLKNDILLIIVTIAIIMILGPILYKFWFNSILTIGKLLSSAQDGDIITYLKKAENLKKIKDSRLNNAVLAINKIFKFFIMFIGRITKAAEDIELYVEKLIGDTEHVNLSAQQISQSIEEIAKGASEQAAAAQQTSSSINNMVELAEMIDKETDSSGVILKDLVVKVGETRGVLNGLIDQLKQSAEYSKYSVNSMKTLQEQTSKITNFVAIVTEISERTNLLALNAAIEAARAGEHGRGFSVVAEEVRKLAEQTAKEAEEIKKVAMEILEDSEKTSMQIEKGLEEAINNISQGENSRVYFEDIEKGIEELDKSMGNIKNLSHQQVENVKSVLEAAEKMAAVSEQTAASSQEVAASSEQQTMAIKNIVQIAKDLSIMSRDLSDLSNTIVDKYEVPEEVKSNVEIVKKEILKLACESFVINNDIEKEKKAFNEVIKRGLNLAFIANYDINGECRYTTSDKIKLTSIMSRTWFKKAASGETFVSRPFIGIASNKLHIMVTTPIRDKDKIIGVLAASMEV